MPEVNKTEQIEEPIEVLKTRKLHIEQRLSGYRFKGWILLTFAIVGGSLGYAFSAATEIYSKPTWNEYLPRIIMGAIVGLFGYFYFTFYIRIILTNSLRRIDYKLAQLGADELKEKIEEDFFTKLVQINFKYIDQYYLQTQEQADKSFRLSMFASVSGLIIIAVGVFMMYSDKTQPAYVTTAAGLVSQFISAVFFYLYNKTILKMSQYHQKLVLTQNISLALKITNDMKEEAKNKALETLVDRLTTDVNKYLTDNRD